MQRDKVELMRVNPGTCLRMEKENFPSEFAKMLIFKPRGTGGRHMGKAFLRIKQTERKTKFENGIQGKIKTPRLHSFVRKLDFFEHYFELEFCHSNKYWPGRRDPKKSSCRGQKKEVLLRLVKNLK